MGTSIWSALEPTGASARGNTVRTLRPWAKMGFIHTQRQKPRLGGM